jgi:hypothetical protein
MVTDLHHFDEEQDPDPHKLIRGQECYGLFRAGLQIRCRQIEIRMQRIESYEYESGNDSSPEVPSNIILAERINDDLFNGFFKCFSKCFFYIKRCFRIPSFAF